MHGFTVGDRVSHPMGEGLVKGIAQIGQGHHALVASDAGQEHIVPLAKLRKLAKDMDGDDPIVSPGGGS